MITVTATWPDGRKRKISHDFHDRNLDRLVKKIPGLSSKNVYDLKTGGFCLFEERGATVTVEAVEV